ncbi:MAG: ABC transporter permease, partial [Mesotoga sp.]
MISKENMASVVRRYGVLFALIAVFAVFSFMEPTFYSVRNILSIIRQASITGILAIGLTTVVIAGEFDMSFASLAGFSGVLSLILMGKVFMGAIPAWILSVLAALGIGALNGLIILFIGVPSIITTIGMMTLLAGFTKWLTGG